jgi:hypothetical protein
MHFGIVRHDGSYKPVAQTLERIAREDRQVLDALPQPIVNEADYYASLPIGAFDYYRAYCRVYS